MEKSQSDENQSNRGRTHPGHEHARHEQLPRVVRVVLLQQLQVGRRRGRADARFHPSLPVFHRVNRGDAVAPSTHRLLPPPSARGLLTARALRHVGDRGRAREHQRAGVLEPLPRRLQSGILGVPNARVPRGAGRDSAGGTLVAALARVLVVAQGVHRGPVVLGFDVQEPPGPPRGLGGLALDTFPRGRRGRFFRRDDLGEIEHAQASHVLAIAGDVREPLALVVGETIVVGGDGHGAWVSVASAPAPVQNSLRSDRAKTEESGEVPTPTCGDVWAPKIVGHEAVTLSMSEYPWKMRKAITVHNR